MAAILVVTSGCGDMLVLRMTSCKCRPSHPHTLCLAERPSMPAHIGVHTAEEWGRYGCHYHHQTAGGAPEPGPEVLGNSVDALESAKRAIHLSDVVLRLCITVSHLNRAMYFACDNILWLGKTGLSKNMDQEKWSQRSFRYYLFSLIMNLSRDLYEIKLLMEVETGAKRSSSKMENGTVTRGDRPLHHILALQYVFLNACDLFIPLDKLGLYKTNLGVVGLCGLTSSILGILTILHPWLKLKP
ncbi:unnamed protein product [Ranitomeya imitator]|uniref:Peroxisomal membrane protein 11B n=1 Tax=Ranitomeya imitator TaxID=111125 RepID=A0ABN9KNF6_9NEOB|nr:unnamed protein product [Ranitomeya imitator]